MPFCVIKASFNRQKGKRQNGGDGGIRTLDLSDAKRHIKLFCIISNCFWRFPLGFSFFPPLFSTLISMCYAAVCGVSCGQKRSLPFAGNGFPAWTGSIFRASDCLHCNSESEIRQVLSALSVPQKLGGCKQNEPTDRSTQAGCCAKSGGTV